MVDNAYSLLDRADLVFIDPVGTGVSHPVGKGTGKDFFGVDEDAWSISQFIVKYLNATNRWNSPRYLVGESYGTLRTAVVANRLLTNDLTAFNGMVMVSMVLDFSSIRLYPGADLPFVLLLPSYAASAWYHRILTDRPATLEPFLREVEQFAMTDYASALLAGGSIDAGRRADVLARLHRYTGLSEAYLDRANLRAQPGAFQKELLRSRGMIAGRQDTRFTGPLGDPLTDRPDYDVSSLTLFPAFQSLFNQYARTELRFTPGDQYRFHNYELPPWSYARRGAAGSRAPAGNVLLDLADVLNKNPETRLLVISGIYDLATPYFAARWTMDHLGLSSEMRGNIRESVYQAGHAVYLDEASLKRFKQDIVALIDSTSASAVNRLGGSKR
jgi:carboxypeptidase C (cathepsin A)